MKRILLVFIISFLFAKEYKSCGANKKEALDNLAKQIYVNVVNNYEEKIKLKNKNFNKKVFYYTKQSSIVKLKNLSYFKENNQTCVKVDDEDIKNSARLVLKELLNLNVNNLPENFKARKDFIEQKLGEITFVKAVLDLTSFQIKKLNNLEKKLQDKLFQGEVVFYVNTPTAKIKISGVKKIFNPSTPIKLQPGDYSYKITTINKCPTEGTFSLKAGEKKKIKIFLKNYPKVTFYSNKDDVEIIVNGEKKKIGEIVFNQCRGNIPYQVKYYNQIEEGIITLKPGLEKKIYFDFLSQKEMEKLLSLLNNFSSNKKIELSFGIKQSLNKFVKVIKGRFLKPYKTYKYGGGVSIGYDKNITDIKEFSLFLTAGVEIKKISNNILRFKTIPLLPYIYTDVGYDLKSNAFFITPNLGIKAIINEFIGIDLELSLEYKKKKYLFGSVIGVDFSF